MVAQLIQVVLLIANSCSTFLTVLLLMRFFMQVLRAPFSNQIGNFVLNLTNWLVLPLRRILRPVRGFDTASLAGAYLLQVLFLVLALSLAPGYESPGATTALRIAGAGVLAVVRTTIYLFIVLLVIQAILSWFNPHSPLNRIVGQLTYPILRPLRRIIPPVANIDLTPLVAILLAQIVLVFV